MNKATKTLSRHVLADRFMLTCRVEVFLLLGAILVMSLVSGEPDSMTRSACIAIGWMAIGANLHSVRVKLRQKA